jgi:hypothetical protein
MQVIYVIDKVAAFAEGAGQMLQPPPGAVPQDGV